MKTLLLCCLLGVDGSDAKPEEPRLMTAIRRDMTQVMRREAGAANNAERAHAIYDMTQLYLELKHDPRLPLSETVRSYKAELWSRLTRVKKSLQQQFKREGRSAADYGSPAAHAASQSLAGQVNLAGQSLGGPLLLLARTKQPEPQASSTSANGSATNGSAAGSLPTAGGHGGGAAPPDFGPELVDLIQRTIAPDFWDVNGGPGSIVYYRAFHCLVVRATGEVHEKVGGVLGGLGGK